MHLPEAEDFYIVLNSKNEITQSILATLQWAILLFDHWLWLYSYVALLTPKEPQSIF